MFWLRNKKNNFQLRTLILVPENRKKKFYFSLISEIVVNDMLSELYLLYTLPIKRVNVVDHNERAHTMHM